MTRRRARRGAWHDAHDPFVRDEIGRAFVDGDAALIEQFEAPSLDDIDPLVVDPIGAAISDHIRIGSPNRLREHRSR